MSLAVLEGFVVAVTADRRANEQAELLQRRGASVLFAPTIETTYLSCDAALKAATTAVIDQRPDYLVVTTGIGVRAWLEASQSWGMADELSAAISTAKILARGAKAAGTIQSHGFTVWQRPDSELLVDAQEILLSESLAGKRIAVQLYGEPAPPQFIDALRDAGAEVIEVPVYRWRLPESPSAAKLLIDQIVNRAVDAVTFTSAPAVRNLFAVAEQCGRRDDVVNAFNTDVVAACIGPVCASAAIAEGVTTSIAPSVGRLGLLVRELSTRLSGNRRTVNFDDLEIVMQGKSIAINGELIKLTDKELAVFKRLLTNKGAVVSRKALLEEVWGSDADMHVVEVTIGRLRRRLGAFGSRLVAVTGRGYRIDGMPASSSA